MTTQRDRLVNIGARIVRHGWSINLQMAEVMVPRDLLQRILEMIDGLRPNPPVRRRTRNTEPEHRLSHARPAP